MIRAVIVMNDQGKPRLLKFYQYQPVEKQHEIIRTIYGVLCSRADNVSNFVNVESIFGPVTYLRFCRMLVLYTRHLLYDAAENELAILDLMQVFVETLDKCFSNVCELDIVFNFNKVHTILDEIIVGGQVLETSSSEVVKAVNEISSTLQVGEDLKFNHACSKIDFSMARVVEYDVLWPYCVLCSRADNVSNFVNVESIFGPDARLVYKTFATLYFVFVFDAAENELAILDLMQVFVETLDKCLSNVCELDIVFNFNKVHTILDEIIVGGQVLETSSSEVVKAINEISRLEKTSNSIMRVPKSISAWQGR